MLAIGSPKLLDYLHFETGVLLDEAQKLFLSDRHAINVLDCSVNEHITFPIHDLEAANNCRMAKLAPKKLFVVYFIADVVAAFGHEHHLEAFFHLIGYYLTFAEFSDFKGVH